MDKIKLYYSFNNFISNNHKDFLELKKKDNKLKYIEYLAKYYLKLSEREKDILNLKFKKSEIDKIKFDEETFSYIYNFLYEFDSLKFHFLKNANSYLLKQHLGLVDKEINKVNINAENIEGYKHIYRLILLNNLKRTRDYLHKEFDKHFDLIELARNNTNQLINDNLNFEGIDQSNTSNQEKLILLYRLGVIDHLNELIDNKNTVKQLAEVLSALTGIRANTLNSMLNPLIRENSEQKNNPFYNPKNIAKAEKRLQNLSITPIKENIKIN